MSPAKVSEVTILEDCASVIIPTHGLSPIGLKNPSVHPVRISLQVGFVDDTEMYDLLEKAGSRQFYNITAKSFVAFDPVDCSNVERIRLIIHSETDEKGDTPEALHLVLAYRR